MKKSLTLIAALAMFASAIQVNAQWAEFNGDLVPGEDMTSNIRVSEVVVGETSTNTIEADADDATNNVWKFDVNTLAADVLKYDWQPSYYDFDSEENVPVPAPMTIAAKMKWVDTTGYDYGLDIELRTYFKVQAKVMKKGDGFVVQVKDWSADENYPLPESFDPREWHVLRLTQNDAAGAWSLYVNENDTPFATGTCGKAVDKHVAILGAYAENGKYGVLVDWIGLIEDQAASPATEAMPAGLFTPEVGVFNSKAAMQLQVYPNPTSDRLILSVEEDMLNAAYEIHDITGKTVADGMINSLKSDISVSELASGLYFLKANGAAKQFIVK